MQQVNLRIMQTQDSRTAHNMELKKLKKEGLLCSLDSVLKNKFIFPLLLRYRPREVDKLIGPMETWIDYSISDPEVCRKEKKLVFPSSLTCTPETAGGGIQYVWGKLE